MIKIQATVKAPQSEVSELKEQLLRLGVKEIQEHIVPYERFLKESRLNYDCVFINAWEERQDMIYLIFYFEDSAQGRKAAFDIEYNLKQIPLNLRYINNQAL